MRIKVRECKAQRKTMQITQKTCKKRKWKYRFEENDKLERNFENADAVRHKSKRKNKK